MAYSEDFPANSELQQTGNTMFEDMAMAWRPNPKESDYEISHVDGEVPPELNGTLYRNGPNQCVLPKSGYRGLHFFDGDGMVQAFQFDNGRVRHLGRYSKTPGFLLEQDRGQYFGGGACPPEYAGEDLVRVPRLNTNAVVHSGRLFSMAENSPPFELDPVTLASKGFWEYDGKMLGAATSAHPKIDGRTGQMVIHGYQLGETAIQLYTVEPDGSVSWAQSFEGRRATMLHDLAISENHVIVPVSSFEFRKASDAAGGADDVAFGGDLTLQFGVCRRQQGAEMLWFDTGIVGVVYHPGNAYERDGKIYMDSPVYHDPEKLFADVSTVRRGHTSGGMVSNPYVFEFDLEALTVKSTQVSDVSAELPRIDDRLVGHYNRFGYAVLGEPNHGAEFACQIGKYSPDGKTMVRSRHVKGQYVGEPIFVPRSANAEEDDGFILHQRYHAESDKSSIDILDARDLDQDPVARLWLETRMPLGFHGNWAGAI